MSGVESDGAVFLCSLGKDSDGLPEYSEFVSVWRNLSFHCVRAFSLTILRILAMEKACDLGLSVVALPARQLASSFPGTPECPGTHSMLILMPSCFRDLHRSQISSVVD